ncbi:MAG: M56 family metallopeptidase, partial [bacterium]
LEAVLLHEQSHLRHRDPASLLVTRALGTAFFFAPVVKALAGRHRAAVELAADDDVIAAQGQTFSLASAVVKLLRMNTLPAAGAFMAGADLRLSRLLDGHVALPDLPQRLKVRSGTALVLMSLPMVAAYGLAETINGLSLFLRCTI